MSIDIVLVPPSTDHPETFSALADQYCAAQVSLAAQINATAAAMNLNDTTDASTTSVALGTGSKTFTVTAGKSFQKGMSVQIAYNSSTYMHGIITSYSGTTLIVNVTHFVGTVASYADWTITQASPMIGEQATAQYDFLMANSSLQWVKATLAEVKAVVSPIPAGTRMWFYENVAPVGWTLGAIANDGLLAVKGGSTYVTGGTTAGTWTQPGHVLTEAEMPWHRHTMSDYYVNVQSASAGIAPTIDKGASGSQYTQYAGSNAAHNHGSTYRPFAAVGIICTKD